MLPAAPHMMVAIILAVELVAFTLSAFDTSRRNGAHVGVVLPLTSSRGRQRVHRKPAGVYGGLHSPRLGGVGPQAGRSKVHPQRSGRCAHWTLMGLSSLWWCCTMRAPLLMWVGDVRRAGDGCEPARVHSSPRILRGPPPGCCHMDLWVLTLCCQGLIVVLPAFVLYAGACPLPCLEVRRGIHRNAFGVQWASFSWECYSM